MRVFKYTIYISLVISYLLPTLYAQDTDTSTMVLNEAIVTTSTQQIQNKRATLHLDIINKEYFRDNFTANFVQTLENIPGVHAMNIGSGFAKPVIRGWAFNRVSVIENGIKQEGQQWGADHGLEIDPFSAEQVNVRKGPSSLLYGSDAMGGAIEIVRLPMPTENQIMGEALLFAKSVNEAVGGSFMLGIKKSAWLIKARYSEQHFGDFKVPTDTVVYLTQRLPIYGRRLKNTAGYERDANLFVEYNKHNYQSNYTVSNVYQKMGFFPGAHGIPDAKRLVDDGNSRNIDLPYSTVNHFKTTTHQQYKWNKTLLWVDAGFQNNHREELSAFHTHYGQQTAPKTNPDRELAFFLNTYNANLRAKFTPSATWEHTIGIDNQYQTNTIAGYSFLLPEYNRYMIGGLWLTNYKINQQFLLSGGVRFDYGKIDIQPFTDVYLAAYLYNQGYSADLVNYYKQRSYEVHRTFNDISGSLGFTWEPSLQHLVKMNVGRSFRLPAPNELASNGVHHGTFRHEQGSVTLKSETGWQIDVAYTYKQQTFAITISPFFSWFSNYIFLKPTGEWSVLPHAGQIYRYTGAEALFAGGELAVSKNIFRNLTYQLGADYTYTYNIDENIPLSFSPPLSVRNILQYTHNYYKVEVEYQYIGNQNRVARNELPTNGANLLHAQVAVKLPFGTLTDIEVMFSARNILNTKYLNHLSFYRKIEVPEPGRNFQLLIKIPFKKLLK